jgi:hypothetical protein
MECRIAGCSDLVKAKGLCNRHYLKLRRYGDPEAAASVREEAGLRINSAVTTSTTTGRTSTSTGRTIGRTHR